MPPCHVSLCAPRRRFSASRQALSWRSRCSSASCAFCEEAEPSVVNEEPFRVGESVSVEVVDKLPDDALVDLSAGPS
jgi:hypothetical protein